jgi:hypothetical protein
VQERVPPHNDSLLSDEIEQQYIHDPTCFDIGLQGGALNFLSGDEHKTNPMVQLTAGTDTMDAQLTEVYETQWIPIVGIHKNQIDIHRNCEGIHMTP